MELITAINQHCRAAAESGDWPGVVATLRAITITAPARECFGVETADALDSVGDRRRAIMLALQNDPDGRYCLQKLASDGVLWAHRLTVKLMDGLIAAGVMTATDKAALIQLSSPTIRPFADIIENDIVAAMQAQAAQQALELIRQRRQQWDSIASNIRSRIESGELGNDAAVLAAVQSAVGV